MANQKLVCFSFDAMVREDIENTLKDYPHFAWMLENGAQVDRMRTVYPSVTYPVHVSLQTGATVGHHGVTGNEVQVFGKPGFTDWNWYYDAINPEVKTFFQEAKEAGLSTASVFWPVTGNNPYIDYLITEIWESQGNKRKVFTIDAFRASGTRADILERICRPHEHLLYDTFGMDYAPTVGNFSVACARDFIRLWQPDVLFIHVGFIDYARHTRGMFSETLTERLHYADEFLGVLMDTAEEYGTFDQTNWVVLSDHGQVDIEQGVALNVKFAEDGWIRLDEEGNVKDWDIFAQSTAASCEIFLRDKNDKELEKKTHAYLLDLMKSGKYGIERVYTEQEARDEEQLYGNFSFILEGDGKTGFSSAWKGRIVTKPDDEDYRFSRATHGYHPDKGPQPPFVAAGPAFKKGARLERRSVLDVAPTLAKALGFEMTTADGKVMEELLK